MKPLEIKRGVYWVGGIDWKLRNFHGYATPLGSTYNAYLIIDEKIVLVDTVKSYLFDEMQERIKEVVDPAKINYVVSNHVEMDHSGSLPKIMEICKGAEVITSPIGMKGLAKHFYKDWKFKVVSTGDSINIGKRNLKFVLTPMVHWPDSMATYLPEEKLLMPNDSFGQHIASPERFDDEIGWDIVKEEAAKYYANIILPHGAQVKKALEIFGNFAIDMIAPSHGAIWRRNLKDIYELYKTWADNITKNQAVIVYDTMWGSTEIMANMIYKGFDKKGIAAFLMDLKNNDSSVIMTKILSSRFICVGSSTINNGMLPTVSSFLTYLKGLAPKNRVALAFGSYGWSGESIGDIEKILTECGFKSLSSIKIKYVPSGEELDARQQKLQQELDGGML